jgi:hypothetical protein
MNYTEIVAAVLDTSHRTDLASKVDSFIVLAENNIFRELSLRIVETSSSGTTSGDTIAFPAGFGNIERIEIEDGGVKFTLTYTSPNDIEALTASTGRPSRFTVENGAIRLIAAPSGTYTYTLFYIPELTALTASSVTTWLSTNHPDVYINGVMCEIAKYSMNDEMLNRYMPFLNNSLESVKRSDEQRRFPLSGGLQIRVRSAR